MRIGRKLLVGLGLIIALVAFAFYATSGLVEEADAFLTLVSRGETRGAYLSTAQGFQAGISEWAFLEFVRTTSLSDYQSASWSFRSIENDRGYLEGTVTTKSGGKIPLSIQFVKEDGSWKILAIRRSMGGRT